MMQDEGCNDCYEQLKFLSLSRCAYAFASWGVESSRMRGGGVNAVQVDRSGTARNGIVTRLARAPVGRGLAVNEMKSGGIT